MMDWHAVGFFIIAFIIVISSIMVLKCREIVHSAMFLALTFVMVGCLYIVLNAEYVAMVQIIIYGGAVTVLMLFAIMLTKRKIIGDRDTDESRAKLDVFYELTTVSFLFWFILLSLTAPMLDRSSYDATLNRHIVDVGGIHQIGTLMFTEYLLPFLIVGALLAVAMLAGTFMAKDKEED